MNQSARRAWIIASISALLFAITLAVFWRVLDAEFVRWDDNVSIFENKNLGGLSPHRLLWAFTDVETTMRYVPLSLLSWIITYQFCELQPLGYHLGNLLFHGANVAMAFVVMLKLLAPSPERPPTRSTIIAAALGALAWGLHPLRVEPVAWCTARTYDQSLFFMLIALWSYLNSSAAVNPSGWRRL